LSRPPRDLRHLKRARAEEGVFSALPSDVRKVYDLPAMLLYHLGYAPTLGRSPEPLATGSGGGGAATAHQRQGRNRQNWNRRRTRANTSSPDYKPSGKGISAEGYVGRSAGGWSCVLVMIQRTQRT